MQTLLKKLNKYNIKIDLVDGKLDIEAPKGVITADLLNEIKLHKNDLIEFITLYKTKKEKYLFIPHVPVQPSYVLSSSQRRLWLLSQFEGGNATYNMPSVLELKGDVSISSLQNAFQALIERHESLRTRFKEDETGKVRQFILNPEDSKFQLQFEDISNGEYTVEIIKEMIQKEISYSFDLSTDSLLRAKLVKSSQDTHVFVFVMHHIISDGQSAQVMTNELFVLYDSFVKGNENPLPALTLQYKDYAAWQQDLLKSENLLSHKSYWLQQFEGELPILDLPTYQTRPAIKTYNGKSVNKVFSENLFKDFSDLCQSQGSTLFMGLLAVTKSLLYRYTNQTDIVIGSPIAGREHIDLQNQIGFYVNTLALRTQSEGKDTFKEVLVNVKEVTLGAYEHQVYPFDELVVELTVKRDLSRNPLFDVMVTLQNTDNLKTSVQIIDAIEVKEFRLEKEVLSKFDMDFAFAEINNGLRLTLTYNTDLYSEEFTKRILNHFEILLFNIVQKSDVAINSLNYLTELEKHQLLVGFNNTEVAYSKDKTIVDLFEEQVDKTPNNVAVVFEEVKLTYQELNEKSNQLAYYLRENYSIKPDDLIGIKLDRSEIMIITILGILKSGAAYVPIDINYPQERIAYIEKDSNSKVVIDETILQNFKRFQESYAKENIDKIIQSNDLAYVIYTSGTTGNPKGVMVEHRNALEFINWSKAEFNLSKFDIVYAVTSYCFDLSIYEMFYTLSTGKKIRLLRNALDISHHLENDTNVLLNTVPSVIGKLLEDNISLNNVCNINMAGEVLPTDIISKLPLDKIEVRNLYGPSEDTTYSTSYLLNSNKEYLNIPIGRPISNTQVYILDNTLQPLPIGVTGNLYISGAGVARGYLNKPELTSKKFISNPFIEGERMYDTGDLGCWLADGNIEFLGRKDHQIKIRGYRIELGEIENVILQYSEDLKQVVVEAKEVNEVKVLVAYLVSTCIDKSELRSFLKNRLPDYMIPGFYVALEKLPLTPNGKIDRKALSGISGDDIIRREYVAPRNKTEEILVVIWQEVLGVREIGITDSFFELGGHSLIVGQVINRTHKQLGKTVSFKAFFATPTIEGLSEQLRENEYIAIPKAQESASYPLTASQSRLWILSQLEGGSLAYNMPGAVKLTGAVDVNKFEESFRLLIDRHEILRTYFKADQEGEIRQHIQDKEDITFSIEEKDYSLENNQEEVVVNYLEERNNIPFNLEQGNLVRACLIKTKEEEYIFFLSLHHIIGDGWSLELLISEVIQTYNALKQGKDLELPELNIQYKDYAVWLQDELQQEKHKVSENYWVEQFSGELPVLDLPSFKTRPLIQTFNGNRLRHRFSDLFLEQLKAFSKKHDLTLFMTLMSGVNTMLHKYTGQNDIIIGTPIAGREHPDLENQMGLYLNTLAIRTQFKESSSFYDLAIAQKENLLDAYEHQNYPFDLLVGKLDLKRDMSRSALFDVMVILQNQRQLSSLNADQELSGLEVSDYPFSRKTAQFDLSFTFLEQEDALDLAIEYNTDIYDVQLIERMFSHLENILLDSINHPGRPMAEVDYLTEQEKRELLLEFNDTAAVYEQDKTIVDLFEEQAAKSPNSIAVVFEDMSLSYQELDERSNQFAHYLRENYAIQPDDLIGIKLERSEYLIVAILGVLKSGAAYVPIDINYPQERIAYIEKDSNSKAVIDQTALDRFRAVQENYSKEKLGQITQSNNLAYVIYTSGTTGNPKGVMIEHRNAVNFFHGMNKSLSLDENDCLLAITSVSFDISILELIWTLTIGITITLKSSSTALNNFNLLVEDYAETLDFSLFYFSNQAVNQENKYQFLKESVEYADKNDFSAVWLPERHFHEFGGIFPNPAVLGAGLSTITKNIQIRSGSVVLPLHDVVRVAEEWSIVDNLSNGRVALSIASGWHADDFVLKPENYLERQKIMYEQVDQLKTLWKGGSIQRKNGLDEEISIKVYPKPVSPTLDIYITSGGNPETFRSAGKIGANILTHLLGQEIKHLASNIKIYKQALEENGYSSKNAKISLMLHTYIGNDIEEVKNIVKEPFKAYLSSSAELMKNLVKDFDKNISTTSAGDLNNLLELAFERYWQTAALLGTKESCKKILTEIYSIGVTEIACLVDFGIADADVLKGLDFLTELKENYRKDQKSNNKDVNAITSMQITPSYLEALLEDDNSGLFLKSLKNIIVGGEKFSTELLNKVRSQTQSQIYNMYGPTETTIWSTVQKAQDNSILNIGKPIQNTQIFILDHNKKICPIGVKGELYIGGEGLARGYYNDEKLTSEKFIDFDLFSIKNKKIYKTGDLARWLPDGELEHLGRIDNQVKINGYRIELGEIESALLQHPNVLQVVVAAMQNKIGTKNLVAYCISDKKIDPAELKEFIGSKLPNYMVPHLFAQLSEFPLTPNGKIDRKKLPTFEDVKMEEKYIAPRDGAELKLVEIWSKVLSVSSDKIGLKDNFFDLGGNSLLMIKMLSLLNKEFKTNISLVTGFSLPNIFTISEYIKSDTQDNLKEKEQQTEELYNIMEESYNLLNFNENEE